MRTSLAHAALKLCGRRGVVVQLSIKTPHKTTRRLCGRAVACGMWVWGIVCGRAVLTAMAAGSWCLLLADGRTAMHSTGAVVGATLRAYVDTSVHHQHSIHACTHLRSEEERAPTTAPLRCFPDAHHGATFARRRSERPGAAVAARCFPDAHHGASDAPEASREDGTESVAMGRALSHTPTAKHRSNVPKPSQASGCSRSHVAASSLAAVQSSIEALATLE